MATSDPAVYVGLCSDPLQLDTDDNWLHIHLCPCTSCSSRISFLLEPVCSPIPDDHIPPVICEAQFVDIPQGGPTAVTLHHE